jgi:cytochrome P450
MKTKFQDVDTPEPGLTAERDPERHKGLRKQLLPAFGGKALHGVELLLYRHVDGFIAQLKEHGTKAEKGIEITKVDNARVVAHFMKTMQKLTAPSGSTGSLGILPAMWDTPANSTR